MPVLRRGDLAKIGEDVTETLELIPRQWKVIQHVREKFSCRACEAITQPPAPSHPITLVKSHRTPSTLFAFNNDASDGAGLGGP